MRDRDREENQEHEQIIHLFSLHSLAFFIVCLLIFNNAVISLKRMRMHVAVKSHVLWLNSVIRAPPLRSDNCRSERAQIHWTTLKALESRFRMSYSIISR